MSSGGGNRGGGPRSDFNVSSIKDETVKASIQREAKLRAELNGMRESMRTLQDDKDKAIRAFQPKQEQFNSTHEDEFEKLMKEKNACHMMMDKLKVKQHERQGILDDFRSLALEIEPLRRETLDLEKKHKELTAACAELKTKHSDALKNLQYQTAGDADNAIDKVEREITAATKSGNDKLLKVLTKQKNGAEKAKKEVTACYNLEERLLATKKRTDNLAGEIEQKKALRDKKEELRTHLKNELDKDKPVKKEGGAESNKSTKPEEGVGEKKKDEFKAQLDKVKKINEKLDANRAKKKESRPKNNELDEVNKQLNDAKDRRKVIMEELDTLKETVPQKRVSYKEDLKFDLMGKGGATLNQLQEDYGVSIRMDNGTLIIAGGADEVAECAEAVESILVDAEANKQKNEIDFDMKLAPQFIGSGGSNIQRLQKASGADIKMDKEHSKILVQGSQESIDTAKELILKFIDDNCAGELRFDASLRDVIIGKGGSVIREQEKVTGCRRINVDRERSMIVMQGSKEAVAKAMAAYTEIIEGMTSNAFTMRCDDRMVGLVIGPGGKTINEIQSTTKAFVECRNGVITIRGAKEAVSQAREMIQDITQRDEVKVPFERYHYTMLTERPWYAGEDAQEGDKKVQGEEGESPLDEIWRVCEVDHMVALRSEGNVAIRGKSKAVNQARSMVEELLRNNRPDVTKIAYPDILFQQFIKRGSGADRANMLEKIRQRIPALVHVDVDKAAKVIEVAGPTEAVTEAAAEVKDFIAKFTDNSKTLTIAGKAVRFVIGSGGSVIQELQKKHKVTLNLDKDTNLLTIWSVEGDIENVDACLVAVEEIVKLAK